MPITKSSSLVSIGIRGIEQANKDIMKAFTQLASGKRITKASDDAAGLAVSASIENKLRVLEKASDTLSQSSSILQVADSTAQQVQDITGRLGELATQAANGTYSSDQRAALQSEFNGLVQELERLGGVDGGAKTINLDNFSGEQVGGAAGSQSTSVQVGGLFYGDALSAVKNISLGSAESSQAGLAAINNLSQDVSTYRSSVIGSTQSRIDYIQEGIAQQRLSGAEALARITDVDVAETKAFLVQSQIRLQSSAKLFQLGRSMDTDFIRSLLA